MTGLDASARRVDSFAQGELATAGLQGSSFGASLLADISTQGAARTAGIPIQVAENLQGLAGPIGFGTLPALFGAQASAGSQFQGVQSLRNQRYATELSAYARGPLG